MAEAVAAPPPTFPSCVLESDDLLSLFVAHLAPHPVELDAGGALAERVREVPEVFHPGALSVPPADFADALGSDLQPPVRMELMRATRASASGPLLEKHQEAIAHWWANGPPLEPHQEAFAHWWASDPRLENPKDAFAHRWASGPPLEKQEEAFS